MAKLNIEARGISIAINTNPELAKEKGTNISDMVNKAIADALRKESRQGGLFYTERGKL